MNKAQLTQKRTIKRVVLVAPPMNTEQAWGKLADLAEVSPPLGLCSIAAYIREKGFEVSIVDGEALHYDLAQTVQHIVDQKLDLVGVTCKTLWIKSAHRVAQELQARLPDVLVVAGGHHPTSLPQRTLKEFSSFDILVLGEGEITFLELLQTLNNGGDLTEVKGLAFDVDGETHLTPPRERIKNLDDLPQPALDLIPSIEKYYRASAFYGIKGASFPLMTSRGCPYRCAFCDRSVYGNRVTFHSPEYVMKTIQDLYHNHQVHYLVISDDNFLLNRSHMFALLDLFKASGLKLKFNCQSRVDTIDEERLRRLKEAGCEQIMFGIESGNQMMLDRMNKGITVEQIKQAIHLTKQAGLRTTGYFIVGFPGETEQTLRDTLNLIHECRFDDLMCAYYTPLPGSEAYQDIEQQGKFNEDYEENNSMTIAFVPNATTLKMLKSYFAEYNNACYMKAYQLLSIPRRVPTLRHLRAMINSFSTQYN